MDLLRVCGLTNENLRDAMQAQLDIVGSQWLLAWCLFDDFNIIIYLSERLRCSSFGLAMLKILDFIAKLFLVDFPLVEGEFMWFCDSDIPSLSRIDKVMVSRDWEEHFLDMIQRIFSWVVLDHCPLQMEARGMPRAKIPFKFENMWLKVEGFVDTVRQWQNGYHFMRHPSYVLACKLKALKGDLKYWNKHVFGMYLLGKID